MLGSVSRGGIRAQVTKHLSSTNKFELKVTLIDCGALDIKDELISKFYNNQKQTYTIKRSYQDCLEFDKGVMLPNSTLLNDPSRDWLILNDFFDNTFDFNGESAVFFCPLLHLQGSLYLNRSSSCKTINTFTEGNLRIKIRSGTTLISFKVSRSVSWIEFSEKASTKLGEVSKRYTYTGIKGEKITVADQEDLEYCIKQCCDGRIYLIDC